jgi:hypothetical protein
MDDGNGPHKELDWLADAEMDVPSMYVDRFYVRITEQGVRIAFGENWNTAKGKARVAIALSHGNAEELSRLIGMLLRKAKGEPEVDQQPATSIDPAGAE